MNTDRQATGSWLRQDYLSAFHQILGLVMSGTNSKPRPETTFSETGHLDHPPISGAMRRGRGPAAPEGVGDT